MNVILTKVFFDMKYILLIILIWGLLIIIPVNSFSQNLTQERGKEFIISLIENRDDLEDFALEEELDFSKRLNISYKGIKHKFLISYDIDPLIREGIRTKTLDYELKIEKLSENYSRLIFLVPEKNYKICYYFKGQFLISPIYYYTEDWKRLEYKYFTILLSDTTLFNEYSAQKLEKYTDQIFDLLQIEPKKLENLRKSKVSYILCKNEDEIERLTGFRTRGIYILAYDYIVTTFNCHYHELLHLLINFKLQKLPLYTHPFLREGFAVAIGGRGGKEPEVILDLGLFLAKSDMIDIKSLISKDGFYRYDVSLSYPMSGLYNYFLIEEFRPGQYLNLYNKYSGRDAKIMNSIIDENDLPSLLKWENFLTRYAENKSIDFKSNHENLKQIFQKDNIKIAENNDYYHFRLKDTILLSTKNPLQKYKSKKCKEILPEYSYNGEKYLINANSNEISIFNLYTNNLIAKFVSSFSIPVKNVPQKRGLWEFSILKTVFDENISSLYITELHKY